MDEYLKNNGKIAWKSLKSFHAISAVMKNMETDANIQPFDMPERTLSDSFDYSFVSTTARVARYDDFKSAPQITEIPPAETQSFIENLTVTV